MCPRAAKIDSPKTLLAKRLQQLFGFVIFSEISPKYGTTGKTFKGYLVGECEPSPSFLKLVCDNLRVDFEWLIAGKSLNIRALSYAFFPLHEEQLSAAPFYYQKARLFSQELFHNRDFNRHDFKERCYEIIASLLFASSTTMFDPMQEYTESLINDGKEADANLFDFHDYFEHASSFCLNRKFHKAASLKIDGMIESAIDPDIEENYEVIVRQRQSSSNADISALAAENAALKSQIENSANCERPESSHFANTIKLLTDIECRTRSQERQVWNTMLQKIQDKLRPIHQRIFPSEQSQPQSNAG